MESMMCKSVDQLQNATRSYLKPRGLVMKLLLCGAVAVCAMVTPAQSNGGEQKELLKTATAVWAAFQNKDMTAMQALTTSAFVFIGKEGILSGTELGARNAKMQCAQF